MKKTITGLALFACILIPITQVHADSNIQVANKAFILENTQQSGNKVQFDIWVTGSADAVVEIFDKNGVRTGWKTIAGDKKSSDIVGDIGDKWSDMYEDIVEGNILNPSDRRNHISAEKSTVELNIPTGGSFRITKSGDLAKAVNYANTGFELLGQIGIMPDVFDKSAGGEAAKAFAQALIKKPALLLGLSASQNSELTTTELYSELAQVGIGVLKSIAIASGDNIAKEILKGSSSKLLKKGLSAWITGAEALAFVLTNDSVRRDLNNHNNNNKYDITGTDSVEPQRATIVPTNPSEDESIYLSGNEDDSEEVELITLVNPNTKPTQAELDAKAKEQLAIARTIAGKGGTLENLNSQLQTKQSQLRALENQAGSVDEAEYQHLKSMNTFYLQAYFINKKYKGNIKGISPNDMKKLTMLAKNTLGSGREWRTLFTNSHSLFNDTNKRYRDIKKRRTGGTNNRQIAQIRKEIAQLEHTITPKTREMEELLFEFNQSKQELAILVNDNNDDSKVVEAHENNPENSEFILWNGSISIVGSSPTDYTYEYGDVDEPNNALPHGSSSIELHNDGLDHPIIVNADYGAYSYVAWGQWDGTGTTHIRSFDGTVFDNIDGHWVYGDSTIMDDIPKQGSANYAGNIIGGYVNHGTGLVEPNSITGTINMNVSFRDGNNSLAGTMQLDRNGASWATANINTNNGRPDSDEQLSAQMTVQGGGNGELRGNFYGPNAEELGGGFYIDKQSGDGGGAAGVFRAKKQ